jgi:hypothetical protein
VVVGATLVRVGDGVVVGVAAVWVGAGVVCLGTGVVGGAAVVVTGRTVVVTAGTVVRTGSAVLVVVAGWSGRAWGLGLGVGTDLVVVVVGFGVCWGSAGAGAALLGGPGTGPAVEVVGAGTRVGAAAGTAAWAADSSRGDGAGVGVLPKIELGATAATTTAVAPMADVPTWLTAVRNAPSEPWPTIGSPASHAVGPIAHCSRRCGTASRARTTTGSKWVPAQATSSARAASRFIGLLYERTAVIASKESATVTMREPSLMARPARPPG